MNAYSIRNNVRQLQLCDRKTIGIINAQFFYLLHEENEDISNCTNEFKELHGDYKKYIKIL